MLYVLKMDNPSDPEDAGIPTRMRLIGPFPDKNAAFIWASNPVNNPYDNPCYQIVELGVGIMMTQGTSVLYPLPVHRPDDPLARY
jgi:hypothetical protein